MLDPTVEKIDYSKISVADLAREMSASADCLNANRYELEYLNHQDPFVRAKVLTAVAISYFASKDPNYLSRLEPLLQVGLKENIPEAAYFLGCLELESTTGSISLPKAIEYLKKSAELEYVPAFRALANLYLTPEVEIGGFEEAEYYLYKGCAKNDADCQFLLAEHLFKNSSNDKSDLAFALSLLQKAADVEHPKALKTLGLYYLSENNSDFRPLEGLSLLEKSYSLGCLDAGFELAIVLTGGACDKAKSFIDVEEERAFSILVEITQGEYPHMLAKVLLADFYQNGIGCEPNNQKAEEILIDTIQKYSSLAAIEKIMLLYISLGEKEKAFNFAKQGALLGIAQCQYNLAFLYFDPELAGPDLKLAYAWAVLATEQGWCPTVEYTDEDDSIIELELAELALQQVDEIEALKTLSSIQAECESAQKDVVTISL